MGYSLKPIHFWLDTIPMSEIVSATNAADFQKEGKPINSLGQRRLGHARLEQFDDSQTHYLLTLRDGAFIEFFDYSINNQ